MLHPFLHPNTLEAGCDEAGRGCLAGPVFAAAVILPKKFKGDALHDSKILKVSQRNELRQLIEQEALCWAVASVNNKEIDDINILNASFLAMHRAIEKLKKQPEMLLIDGNRFKPYSVIPHTCIIKGDGLYQSIAAASILAKTHRDEYMLKLHENYPYYKWNENKGYPTMSHRKAIVQFGITPEHRTSFRLYPAAEQLELF